MAARRKSLNRYRRARNSCSVKLLKSKNVSKDISEKTLLIMVILVLVVSVLSVSMYLHAFYSGSYSGYTAPKSSKITAPRTEEQPTVSGMATMQIIEPPKENK